MHKSEGQTGAIAPSLDPSCTNRTANRTCTAPTAGAERGADGIRELLRRVHVGHADVVLQLVVAVALAGGRAGAGWLGHVVSRVDLEWRITKPGVNGVEVDDTDGDGSKREGNGMERRGGEE